MRSTCFSSTSTYFETEEADGEIPRNGRGEPVPPGSEDTEREAGFRTHGNSKDSRPDLRGQRIHLAECEAHYNGRRPHRSRELRPPRPDHPAADLSKGRIRRRPVLGGLVNEYERAA